MHIGFVHARARTGTPVSYTHLDVYKRQDQYIIFSGPYRSASEGNGPWIFPQAIAAAFGIYNDWMVDEAGNVYYICLLYTSRCV